MAEQPKGSKAKEVGRALADHQPWIPYLPSPEEIGALQSIARGDAEAHQQRRALECIIKISRNDGALFFPGEDGRRTTDFALGRAFVADQVRAILNIKLKPRSEQG